MSGAATLELTRPALAAASPRPDLERFEAGYRVAVFYRPSLERPAGAVLAAFVTDGSPIDSCDVAAAVALEAFRHPALTLDGLAEYLTRRPDPLPEEIASDSEEDPSDV